MYISECPYTSTAGAEHRTQKIWLPDSILNEYEVMVYSEAVKTYASIMNSIM